MGSPTSLAYSSLGDSYLAASGATLVLGRQSSFYPILLALGVIPYILVTHVHQFTGGFLRGGSSGAPTVDHYVRLLVGQQLGCQLPYPIGRQVYCARQVSVTVVLFGEGLDEDEVIALIYHRGLLLARCPLAGFLTDTLGFFGATLMEGLLHRTVPLAHQYRTLLSLLSQAS